MVGNDEAPGEEPGAFLVGVRSVARDGADIFECPLLTIQSIMRNKTRAILFIGIASFWPLISTAQAPAKMPLTSALTAWLAGGIGVPGSGVGPVAEWEAGLGYGFLTVGYQGSRTEDFNGSSRDEHAMFGGVRVPWRRGSVRLEAGVGQASTCRSNGEQSGTCSRSRDSNLPVIKASADLLLAPAVGVYVSTLQPTRREIAFATYVIGVELGKLRRQVGFRRVRVPVEWLSPHCSSMFGSSSADFIEM